MEIVRIRIQSSEELKNILTWLADFKDEMMITFRRYHVGLEWFNTYMEIPDKIDEYFGFMFDNADKAILFKLTWL